MTPPGTADLPRGREQYNPLDKQRPEVLLGAITEADTDESMKREGQNESARLARGEKVAQAGAHSDSSSRY